MSDGQRSARAADAAAEIEEETQALYARLTELAARRAAAPHDHGLQHEYDAVFRRLREVQKVEAEHARAAFRAQLALPRGEGYRALQAAREELADPIHHDVSESMTPPVDEDPDDPDILDKGEKLGGGGFPAPWARERSKNDTAQRPPPIMSSQKYRIAVIGFWRNPDVLSGVLDAAYPKIFDSHDGPKIALHPGVAFGESRRWPADADVEEVRNAARVNEVTALFEAKIGSERPAYKAVAPDGSMLPVEIYQRFATSGQANADLDMVAKLVKDCGPRQQRTLNLAGLPLGLLVCGENNVLINPKSDGYQARVRYPRDAQIFEHVRVVFNGTHYTMRNWGKMDARFRYLSSKGRWAFFATNCHSKEWGLTTVRGYYDGQLVANSLWTAETLPAGVKTKVVRDEPGQDRYLALVFDIPGRILVP